jgi:hypothetical protein
MQDPRESSIEEHATYIDNGTSFPVSSRMPNNYKRSTTRIEDRADPKLRPK